jgi:hypothetical protein
VLDQRGRLLVAALGFAGLPRPSYDRSLWALRTWLDSWSGIGRIAVGMAHQGYDLQLTQYDARGLRQGRLERLAHNDRTAVEWRSGGRHDSPSNEEIAMKRRYVITLGLFVVFGTFGCAKMRMPFGGGGWTTLIDGASGLENWDRVGDANWRAEDGAIVADKGKGGFLLSKNSYKDFQIRAEFWADHTTNSGIFIRIADPKKIGADTSYEVNIFDQRPDPSYGTGGIVNFAKVSPMPKAGGKWNTFDITAKGPQLTVVLNGVQTVNIQDSKFAQGPFALQYGAGARDTVGGSIKWRKVQVRPL